MIADRTRDKIRAARRRGHWTGGPPPLGYDLENKALVINEPEAEIVREVFRHFVNTGTEKSHAKRIILPVSARGSRI
jgi:DNA invertase Pin-like site-specific DNA recombinase